MTTIPFDPSVNLLTCPDDQWNAWLRYMLTAPITDLIAENKRDEKTRQSAPCPNPKPRNP